MTALKRDPEFQSDLLGYHLGLMDDAERREFEAGFSDPARLQAACRALDSVLSPLNADPLPPPRAGFVDRILAGVGASRHSLPFKKNSLAMDIRQPVETGGGSLFSMRELMGIAAAIAMFAGIFVPGYYTARQTAMKTACNNNLRQIGAGIASYAEMSDNFMPFANQAPPESKWAASVAGGQEPAVRNSRHLYRLVQGKLVPLEAFVDPGAEGGRVMVADQPERYDDFADPRNNSYASNLVTRAWERNMLVGNMPVAACMTPLVDGNQRLRSSNAAAMNSWNHAEGSGQNVLRANMGVRFHTSPNVGVNNDDIYRVNGVSEYTGMERPAQPEDAFLVP